MKPLVAYQTLSLVSHNELPRELLGLIVSDENLLAKHLYGINNGVHITFYHDACKLFALRLLLQLKTRATSPLLEKAIQRIEQCWKLSPKLLQISQAMFNHHSSKKRIAETNNDHSKIQKFK